MSIFPATCFANRKALFAILASAALPFASASAAIDTYTSQEDFLEVLPTPPGYITEDFSSLPDGEQTGTSLTFENYLDSSVSFVVTTTEAPDNGFWVNSTLSEGPWLGTLAHNYSITIDFGTGVQGVGAFFSLTNIDDEALSGTLSISVNGGAPIDLLTVSSGTQPYLGLLASDGDLIKTVTISTAESESYVSFSNLTVAPIPEPSTVAILGIGAAAIFSLKFRRRRE